MPHRMFLCFFLEENRLHLGYRNIHKKIEIKYISKYVSQTIAIVCVATIGYQLKLYTHGAIIFLLKRVRQNMSYTFVVI